MKYLLFLIFSNIIYAQSRKDIDTTSVAPSYPISNDISLNDSTIYLEVDQKPEFPGGIDVFRNKVLTNFSNSSVTGYEGKVKTEVTFIIEKNGRISDIKADGRNTDFNGEIARSVISVTTKWRPAKIKGIRVRSKYNFPITINFE